MFVYATELLNRHVNSSVHVEFSLNIQSFFNKVWLTTLNQDQQDELNGGSCTLE